MTSSFFSNSFITAFIRSSNWPLYLVPATKLAKSKVTTLLLNRILETLRCIILFAKPSAIADFPTPGSPINSGLFFFLLLRIWDTLWISFSLPTTGSNFPSSAIAVKSRPKLSKTGVFDFLFALFEVSLEYAFSWVSSFSLLENVSALGVSPYVKLSSVIIDLNCSLTLS